MNNFPFSKDLLELAPLPPKDETPSIALAPQETAKIISNVKVKQHANEFLNRLVVEGVIPEMKRAIILEKVVALVESENQ